MPDLAVLAQKQRDALRDNDHLADVYKAAVEFRVNAERREQEARHALLQNAYVIAGVQ